MCSIGGRQNRLRRIRRESLSLEAVSEAVVSSALSGAKGCSLTFFAMSDSFQAEINDKIADLGKVFREFTTKDQMQWTI